VLTLGLTRHRVWHRTEIRVMGSIAELLIDGPAPLVADGVQILRRLGTSWSRFDGRSELARLQAADGRWMPISADLAVALRWSRRLVAETNGWFDPTLLDELVRWGYDRTFREIDTTGRSAPPSAARSRRVDLDVVELSADGTRARLEPGVRLDLGGIGKGLAADLVAADLVARGATAAYVSVGGDIAAAGEPPEDGWLVPVLDPRQGRPFAHHRLHVGGLALSTTALRRWHIGGVNAHHLLDPETGAPSTSPVVAVAVAAASAARAEALAKAALVAGADDGLELLATARVHAWVLVDDDVVQVEPAE